MKFHWPLNSITLFWCDFQWIPKCTKYNFFPRLCPRPRWGSLQCSPECLAGEEGLIVPFQELLPTLGPGTQNTHILFHGAAYEWIRSCRQNCLHSPQILKV